LSQDLKNMSKFALLAAVSIALASTTAPSFARSLTADSGQPVLAAGHQTRAAERHRHRDRVYMQERAYDRGHRAYGADDRSLGQPRNLLQQYEGAGRCVTDLGYGRFELCD
jgi:hypothetical protein